jgi:hypothetical protein
MLYDTGSPTEGRQFDSINEIERAHDARTADETARLMRQEGNTKFKYDQRLLDILKGTEFSLPVSPAAMVLRGQQHNNCVGTYKGQQTNNSTTPLARLFFTATATLELRLEIQFGICVATVVQQFKGRHNKNVECTVELANLRVALTGQPVDIFRVTTVDSNSKY